MVAGIAIEQAIPLGRVWSFPKNIKLRTGVLGHLGHHYDYVVFDDLVHNEHHLQLAEAIFAEQIIICSAEQIIMKPFSPAHLKLYKFSSPVYSFLSR